MSILNKLNNKLIVIVVIVIAAIVLVAGGIYYHWAESGTPNGKPVDIAIVNGQTIDGLASKLSDLHIIRSRTAFIIYLHLHSAPILVAGDYQFRQDSSFGQLFAEFKKGPSVFTLPIPQGFTLNQIAQRVGQIPNHTAAGFLKAAESTKFISPFEPVSVRSFPNGLEGLLGAATYKVQLNESYDTLLVQMIQTFDAQAKSLGLTPTGTYAGNLSAYQIIVAASIVQEEAGLNSDRPKVARVIINRMADSMALQMDSTVRYAIGDPARAPTASDLTINSPYNTYIYKGLPPTPISTVSTLDVTAMLSPAPGPWLYFVVVSGNGQEAFSATYQQQVQNEQLAKSRGLAG